MIFNKKRLDEFYMEYLKDSAQHTSFCYIVKIDLAMFLGQADEECGFSVNKNLIVENMSDESLTAQRFVKDHLKCKEYKLHNMSMPKELLQCVKRSSTSYKEVQQTKKKSQQKLEKGKRLLEIDEELIQLKRTKYSS